MDESEHDFSKLGVVGSRKWPSKQFVFGILTALKQRGSVEVIVSGGQPKGVDGWSEDWAEAVGITTSIQLPAHWRDKDNPLWKPYSPTNYHERNQEIVDESTFVVAFWWEESKGTADTISRCKADEVDHLVLTETHLKKLGT